MSSFFSYLKTTILLAGLTALLILVGYALGGTEYLPFTLFFTLIFNFVAFFFSDKIALAMNKAKELPLQTAPELHKKIELLSKKMGIKKPKLYVSPFSQPNAFATGRGPNNSSVCFTQGLLERLESDQIMAVAAHELAHVKNRDVLIATIAAVIAGSISALTRIFIYSPRRRRDNESGIFGLLALLLAPISAMLLQFAISRNREYAADATAAKYTGKPQSLASALIAISEEVKMNPMDVNPSMHSLYIANPVNSRGLQEFFSTHPLVEKRVERLMEM
jgi:heat shock protein HtpX